MQFTIITSNNSSQSRTNYLKMLWNKGFSTLKTTLGVSFPPPPPPRFLCLWSETKGEWIIHCRALYKTPMRLNTIMKGVHRGKHSAFPFDMNVLEMLLFKVPPHAHSLHFTVHRLSRIGSGKRNTKKIVFHYERLWLQCQSFFCSPFCSIHVQKDR